MRKFIYWTLDELPNLESDWEKIKKSAQPHSEDILYSCLKKPEVISQILNYLKKEGVIPGCKVYAVILDLHSRQYMCRDCQRTTIGAQTIKNKNALEEGFLGLLSKILREVEGYFLPNKHPLRMLTRVSADMEYKGDSAGTEHQHPEQAYNNFKTWEHLVENPKEEMKNEIMWENLKDVERDIQILSGNCIVHRHDHEDLLRQYGFFEVGIARNKLPKAVFTSESPGKVELPSTFHLPLSSYVSLASLWFKPVPSVSSPPTSEQKRTFEIDDKSPDPTEPPLKLLKPSSKPPS